MNIIDRSRIRYRKTKRSVRIGSIIAGLIASFAMYIAVKAVWKRQCSEQLTVAVVRGNETKVQELLKAGADSNAVTQPGSVYTFLVHAVMSTFCRIELPSSDTTITMEAAERKNDRILRDLLATGGDVHIRTTDGTTVLGNAIMSSHHKNVELAVQFGADVNAPVRSVTPLIASMAWSRDLEDFSFLLSHGADPDKPDNYGNTPLMGAAALNNSEIVQILLQRGVSINAQNEVGCTALMQAAENGSMNTVQLLVKAGADMTIRNGQNQTAEEVASFYSKSRAAEFLQRSCKQRLHPFK